MDRSPEGLAALYDEALAEWCERNGCAGGLFLALIDIAEGGILSVVSQNVEVPET